MNKLSAIGAFLFAALGAAIPSAHATLTSSHFTGWTAIPSGTFNSPAALLTPGVGTLQAFAKGMDNRYYQNTGTRLGSTPIS